VTDPAADVDGSAEPPIGVACVDRCFFVFSCHMLTVALRWGNVE
jgi:hypothetical protein